MDIKTRYRNNGYTFHEKENQVNIYGIRSKNSISDKFDDVIGMFVVINGKEIHLTFPATTDPGKNWLLTPMRKDGCAIMVPGQYKGLYKIGLHKDYKALQQIGKAQYVRDNDKNSTIDFSLYRDPEKRKAHIFFDNIASNIHRASKNAIVQYVGLYSAGCQVLQRDSDLQSLLSYCENQVANGWPNLFDYTLFEE